MRSVGRSGLYLEAARFDSDWMVIRVSPFFVIDYCCEAFRTMRRTRRYLCEAFCTRRHRIAY